MNKPLYITGVLIVYLSIAGLVYATLNPLVDMCASRAAEGAMFTTPVCSREESTNWIGFGASLTALASGIVLITRGLKAKGVQKKN